MRTTPAKKPRTECCCQPVAFVIAAMVTPAGARSIASTRACFEFCLPMFFRDFFGWRGCTTAVREAMSVTRWTVGFGIGILRSGSGGIAPPPPKPHLGLQAGGAGSPSASARPELTTVPLRKRREASDFWARMLLIGGGSERQPGILRSESKARPVIDVSHRIGSKGGENREDRRGFLAGFPTVRLCLFGSNPSLSANRCLK